MANIIEFSQTFYNTRMHILAIPFCLCYTKLEYKVHTKLAMIPTLPTLYQIIQESSPRINRAWL